MGKAPIDQPVYRVLILDDDQALGELIKDYLLKAQNCYARYIFTVDDLWDCLRNEQYDILFLDYRLADADGLDILAKISKNGYTLPTVMMTGEGSENIAARAIQNGAFDYLVKGEFSLTILPPLIQKAARHKEIQKAMQDYLDQTRYQALLLNNIRDAVVVWDLHGIIIYWNAAAEKLFGASAHERIGKNINDVYIPYFTPQPPLHNTVGSPAFQIEHQFLLPNGEKVWISAHISTLNHQSSPENPIGTMNVARDITPLKKEQEELVKSQYFVKSILDTSPNIIYLFNLEENRFSYGNPGIKTILNYEVDEFISGSIEWFLSRVFPDDIPRMILHLKDLKNLNQGEVKEFEYRILSRDDEWRWIKSRETVFRRDSQAKPVNIIGVAQDITSSKQIEVALRKSEARYRAIVEDHQTEMICRFLPDMTLTFVNEAYCRYYNRDRGELVGTNFLDSVPENQRQTITDTLTSLSTISPSIVIEQQAQFPGMDLQWQEWTCRAIFDQHNEFVEIQAVGRDITERKKLQETIATAQTHLTQAARMSSIGELASGVAHQISNPLTTIIADAQLLSRDLDKDHPGRESAEAIMIAGWRAQSVINELMKFSQPTRAGCEEIALNATIESALLLASARILASGINLDVHLAENLPNIIANPRQLTDLWVNMLLLARSSITDNNHHTIRISTSLNGEGFLQVNITDDGSPIPPNLIGRVFEPQLIPAGFGRGTGMELSICHELVRQNNGTISLVNSEKETIFQILFPSKGNDTWMQ